MNTTRMKWLVLAAVLGPWCVGLTGTSGCDSDQQPVLRLSDAKYNGGCAPEDHLDQPIALGARLDVQVEKNGDPALVVTAMTSGDGVMDVEDLDNPVGLRAVGVGQTELTVFDNEMASGSQVLSVREIAAAHVSSWMVTPYNFDTALEVPHPEGGADLVKEGYALLPDGTLRLTVRLVDDVGEELAGYGAADWTASNDLVTWETAQPRHDDILVTGLGEPGEVTLSTVAGGSFTLQLLAEGDATTLDVYYPASGERGGPIDLEVGAVEVAVGVVFDEAGRYVMGDDGLVFEATIADEAVAALVPPPWSEGEDGVDLDTATLELLADERVVHVEGLSAGETTLVLEAAGLTLEVPITVSAE